MAPCRVFPFLLLLGLLALLGPALVEAQREGSADDEASAVVFVPEYNAVDCAALKNKAECRKEKSQCKWERSEARCVKKEPRGDEEAEGRTGIASHESKEAVHEEL
eukprot:g58263.t1